MQSLLLPLADALRRGFALSWLALAPYAGKVEVAPARSAGEAAASVALLGFLGWGVTRLAARSRVGAALIVLAVVEALALGLVFSGERAPLGRGLVWLFPVVWGAIAFNAAGVGAELWAQGLGRASPGRVTRVGWFVAAVVFALLGLALGFHRVGSEKSLLEVALSNDPGNERLSLRYAAQLKQARDVRAAEQSLRACATANPEACACAVPLVAAALERAAYTEAGSLLLHSAPECRQRAPAPGMLAEALAGGGETNAARAAAALVLAKDPNDSRALYAQALLALRDADVQLARQLLERAIAAGRAGRARVDLGVLLFKAGDLAGARRWFELELHDDPDDVAAIFDLALVDQMENRYHFAREGYLKALRLEPGNLDARYNLAVLTNAAGARAEAQHHVAAFERSAPAGDMRLAELRKLSGN